MRTVRWYGSPALKVDEKAAVFASSEADVAAEPELVWEVLTSFEAWPSWNPDVKSLSLAGPVSEGTTFRWKPGGATTITSTIREVERPRAIGWTGKTFGVHAVHVWRLEPRHGGTHVETEESFDGTVGADVAGNDAQDAEAWPRVRAGALEGRGRTQGRPDVRLSRGRRAPCARQTSTSELSGTQCALPWAARRARSRSTSSRSSRPRRAWKARGPLCSRRRRSLAASDASSAAGSR